MPPNPILICAPSDPLREQLESLLSAEGYATSVALTPGEAVTMLGDAEIDLIVAEGLAVSGAIPTIRRASPSHAPLLVIAPAGDVESHIAFLEAGADDVVAAEFVRSELEARVEALLIRAGRIRTGAPSGQPAGEIIVFISPKGGVGTTTLAVNTAVLLAGGTRTPNSGRDPVLLVDLDLQFGQVATHLNLNPHFDIAGLAADDQALDDASVASSFLTSHSSGVSVLAAPANPEADFGISVDQLERAITVLRPRFEQIVVDCGSRLDPRTLWMLEQADTHVFVIFPEIAALRAMSLLLGFLAETATLRARSLFVINHIFPKEMLKTRDIENLLRTRPASEIPYTEVEMIRAVNEGVPVVISHPTSPVALAIRQLAQAIIGVETRASSGRPRRAGGFRIGRR
ncbi:MAG: AAA family ATPase [Chloroflexota bacterium]|nr:AAA family ATPase [Chloroflexota bacterium]